jgi:hypothetical protein
VTPKQQKRLGTYARWIANEIELRDWTIVISDDPPSNPDHIACMNCVYGRKRANIHVAADFWTTTPEDQRQAICHELVHIFLKPLEFNLNNVEQPLGTTAFHLLSEAHRDLAEYAVDALADAIAKHLPLPKWAVKREK